MFFFLYIVESLFTCLYITSFHFLEFLHLIYKNLTQTLIQIYHGLKFKVALQYQ